MQCEGSKERNLRAVCPNLANCKTTVVVVIHNVSWGNRPQSAL